jgi:hypothetical protein
MGKEVTVTEGALEMLIASAVRAEVAKLMTASTPDEQIQKALDRARGKDRPLPKEEAIACFSPVTKARFTARLIASSVFPQGRVIELLDYVRPDGWDVPRLDGGLVPDGMDRKNDRGELSKEFANWARKEFWQKDLEMLVGRPLPDQWRADYTSSAPVGSVVITAEQLERLGITAEQIQAATKAPSAPETTA